MTSKNLRRLFTTYNRKYFGNKLPKYKVVFSNYLVRVNLFGDCDVKKHRIRIASDINRKRWNVITKETLLHEMCHAKCKHNASQGEDEWHGPKFEKEMLRLAKKGAFKGIW